MVTMKTPKVIIRKHIPVHRHKFEVNKSGNLTNIPHKPPCLITETVRAKLAIRTSITLIGNIRSTQILRYSGNSEQITK